MKIVLATNNQGKVKEMRNLLSELPGIEWSSLADYKERIEPEETGTTFFDNALIKARAVAQALGAYALADDSGLEVEALGGAPGVYSARYAGEHASDNDNNLKLLDALSRETSRRARFRCVLVIVDPAGNPVASAEATCEGQIAHVCKGDKGFGYDSLFIPDAYSQTMGELDLAEKNKLSHRAQACRLMIKQLERLSS